MELDELKEKWAEHDRKLDESLRLNRQLLREMYTRRARFALWRLAAMLGAGAILTFGLVVWLGAFIAHNWFVPRFVLPAIALDLATIATLATSIVQICLALNIDYNQPVAVIQKRLEMLRKIRIRNTQAILLTATLTWVPIFIVAMKGFLGVDVYRVFGIASLLINVACGLLVLVVGIWLGKKFGPRMGRRFLRDLAGYNLNAASGSLETLAEFEDHERG
jgi:hypothetical protein